MRLSKPLPSVLAAAGFGLLALAAGQSAAAQASTTATAEIAANLPDAPDGTRLAQPTNPSGQNSTGQNSSSQTSSSAPAGQKPEPSSRDKSREQLKREEHQRILGVVPNFNTVDTSADILPLSPKQKFDLMWKSSTDPFIFVAAGFVSGIGQARDSNPGFGQGAQGYGKRFGASYADTVDGNFWGNAVLPILFKEDPRYFRLGAGTFKRRFLYSLSTAVWSRYDSGKWGPNYANVLGNFISGGISNAYYPAADRGVSQTLTGAVTVTAEGAIGSEFYEFWPDISKRIFHKHDPQVVPSNQPPPATPAGETVPLPKH